MRLLMRGNARTQEVLGSFVTSKESTMLIKRPADIASSEITPRNVRGVGLAIRRKKRKHCVREEKPRVARTSERALDFVHDAGGVRTGIRVLSVVDAYTRECLAVEVATNVHGSAVVQCADRRELPSAV
jgi:putative transposase